MPPAVRRMDPSAGVSEQVFEHLQADRRPYSIHRYTPTIRKIVSVTDAIQGAFEGIPFIPASIEP